MPKRTALIMPSCYAQSVRALWLLPLTVLASCQLPSSRGGGEGSPRASAWFDPQARISTAVRMTTPAGVDLRQAQYVRGQSGELSILVLTRDYGKRADGKADPQAVELVPAGPGTRQPLALNEEYLPLRIFVSPERKAWCVAALHRGEGLGPETAPLHLHVWAGGAVAKLVDSQPELCPLGFVNELHIYCRPMVNRRRDAGLILFDYDWNAPAQVYALTTGQSLRAKIEAFASNADSSCIAGFAVNAEPALPTRASITYAMTSKGRAAKRWTLPYFTSEGEDWVPALCFADARTLATVAFRPGALDSASPGLFRVVTLDATSGTVRVVEDRVDPYLTIAGGGGVLFYALRYAGDGAESWELWVASVDGLLKRRLLLDSDARYLSVLDALDGQRVLVHRQYFTVVGNSVELHSELKEIALGTLAQTPGGGTGVGGAESLFTPPGDSAGGSPGGEGGSAAGGETPPVGGPPPIAIP
jgi:hypothetical protein